MAGGVQGLHPGFPLHPASLRPGPEATGFGNILDFYSYFPGDDFCLWL